MTASPASRWWSRPSTPSEISSIKDLANKKVGVSAPGSSTDFFLKYMLTKNGVDPNSVGVIGVGLGASAIAAMEQGQIDAAIMLDPAVTVLAGKYKDLKILSDTRSEKDTLAVFGGQYPGGALYTKAEWIAAHEKKCRAMTNAIVTTLKWIHSHSAEEITAKMPPEFTKDKALYTRRAQEHDGDVFRHRPHGPARAPPRCSRCSRSRRRRWRRPISICRRPIRTLCRRGQQEDGDEVAGGGNGRMVRRMRLWRHPF